MGELMYYWGLTDPSAEHWTPFEYGMGQREALENDPPSSRNERLIRRLNFWSDRHRADTMDRTWKRHRPHQYKDIDMTKSVYKIRRRSDALYSTGGTRPRFSRVGKVWNGLGPLKSHLSLILAYDRDTVYSDCEIVQYQVVDPETSATPIDFFLDSV